MFYVQKSLVEYDYFQEKYLDSVLLETQEFDTLAQAREYANYQCEQHWGTGIVFTVFAKKNDGTFFVPF